MLDIGNYIKEILKYEESVIIQDLGSFVTRYKSAEIKSKTGSISPPTKEIFFDEKIKNDNGRLVNFICEQEKSDPELIRKEVDKFVSETIIKLNHGEHVRIDDLGYLYKDKAYKIQFVQEVSENILLDTYGLQEIEWDMSDQKQPERIEMEKQVDQSKKKLFIIPIVVLLVVILVFAILISERVKNENTARDGFLSGLFSGSRQDNGITQQSNDEMTNDFDSLTNMENALRYEENKYAGYSKFYLIAGSFSIYNNAEQFMYDLDAKGFPAEVLEVDGKIFRVSLKSYTNRNEALKDLEQYKGQFQNRSLWILNSK